MVVSVLHGGGELEVGDTNVIVTAVQENVGLGGRGTKRGEWRTAEGRDDIIMEATYDINVVQQRRQDAGALYVHIHTCTLRFSWKAG